MKELLASRNRAPLERLAAGRALLAFDFDGTLAPLIARHQTAAMRARTRLLLRRLCALYPCAVISGRSQRDTAARMTGVPVRHVIGNHGLEPGGDLATCQRVAGQALELLRPRLAGWPGVELEDKRYSFSLHYRRAEHPVATRRELEAAIAELPVAMRVIRGKLVLNAVPVQAPHKGDALRALMARERTDLALYVGDDVTDEDVFRLYRQPGQAAPARHGRPPATQHRDASQVLTVRIGRSRSSAARYFLREQQQIDELLARLAALRRKRAEP
jgi:trehalose 6-phosphate phosphatase